MKPEPGSVPPRIWVKPASGLWAASPINPDQWTSDVDVARFNIYISLAEHEAALQKANAEVEGLTIERDGAIQRGLMILQSKNKINAQLRERVAKLEEALRKIENGPGNSMSGWKLTWAHETARDAIKEK